MKTATTASGKAGSQNAAKPAAKKTSTGKGKSSTSNSMEHSKLMKLFEDELKDIYWAEKALTKAIPKMSKKASADELVTALDNHLEETLGHVQKLEQVFEMLGKKAQAKKCEAMAGLLKEGEEIMKDTDAGAMRDAGIILAGQKVEHYEIATYGTLRTFAHILGLNDEAALLEEILEQEKAADVKLTEVAMANINVHAAEEQE